MRLLILSPRVPHAGAISGMQIVHQRIDHLIRRGHHVSLACYLDQERGPELLEQVHEGLEEVRVLRKPGVNRMLPCAFTTGRYSVPSSFLRYYSPAMKRTVGEMVYQGQHDAVIAEFSAMGQFFHRNPWLPAVRRIISCHESPTLGSRRQIDSMGPSLLWGKQWLEYRHMRHLEFRLYRAADRVITLTNEERLALLEEDPTVRITPVPPGLHLEAFQPMPEVEVEHGVTITGRFSSEQAHFGALWFLRRVWPLLRRRDPKVVLNLVGRDPSAAMNHHAARDPRIRVTGAVDNLRERLARSKVFACPVLSGSGVRGKILEAMSMGLPVVCTTIGAEGIPIDPGGNALLADAPEIMADFLLMLLHDPEKRASLGARARETVQASFTWEKSVDQLEKLLHDVCSKSSYHGG